MFKRNLQRDSAIFAWRCLVSESLDQIKAKHRRYDIIMWATVILVVTFFVFACNCDMEQLKLFRQRCENRGGTVLSGRGLRACVDSKSVFEVK